MRKHAVLATFLVFLVLGTFLRFFRLRDTIQFLGDQGRDALIARSILIEHDPAFIGPVTSVGNMYLGPLYYYFMVFPLMLSYPDPSGPAYAVAFFGSMTLALIYLLGKDLIGKRAALIAMGLYAISPVVITNVRFSWNPNIVPFVGIILLWLLWKAHRGVDAYWKWIGLCVAILFQLHYITLIIAAFSGIVWIIRVIELLRAKRTLWPLIRSTILAAVIFCLSLTPLAIYDVTHNFLNARAFTSFFSADGQQHFGTSVSLSGRLYSASSILLRNLIEVFRLSVPQSLSLFITALFGYFFIKMSLGKDAHGRRFILGALLFSVMFLTLYKGPLFDHYLGFVFPVAFLVLGALIHTMLKNFLLWPLALGVVACFIYGSILSYPGRLAGESSLEKYERAAQEILRRTDGKTYDILLLSAHKDLQGMNYRYFLTVGGQKPAEEKDVATFSRLFIIDEEFRPTIFDETQYKLSLWPNRKIIDEVVLPGESRIVVLER